MSARKQDYDYITIAEIDGESAAKLILNDRKRITFETLALHFKNKLEWNILIEKSIALQKAEAEGILPTQSNNATIVVGTNVEQQTNYYYINGRKAN